MSSSRIQDGATMTGGDPHGTDSVHRRARRDRRTSMSSSTQKTLVTTSADETLITSHGAACLCKIFNSLGGALRARRRDHALAGAHVRSGRAGPNPSSKTSVFELSEHDARVVTAEAERVRDGDVDVGVARDVRDVIEIALRILDLVV